MREFRPLPPVTDEVLAGLDDAERRDLVAEAFHTFNETAAREVAVRLGVPFADCFEAIERLRHRVQ